MLALHKRRRARESRATIICGQHQQKEVGMSVARYVSALGLLLIVSPASSEWKPEYAQASPERQRWFQSQQINPGAQKRLNVPFKSCCDNGDVFKTRFRVGTAGEDQWEYQDGENWKI